MMQTIYNILAWLIHRPVCLTTERVDVKYLPETHQWATTYRCPSCGRTSIEYSAYGSDA